MSMAKKLTFTIVVLALFITVISLSVIAVFTDTQSVGSNTFSTGTVDISTSPTTALVTYADMAPGDEVTNPITVSNDGTLELRYAVTSTTTEDTLAAQLDLTIKSGVTTCTNAGFDTDGTVVYATGDLGSTTGIDVIGDPTQGSQAGDRTLASLANEELCFNVLLPSSTGNTFQGLTTTATFAFQAEQTQSNP
jgi:spore coat-associated protein N